ncbi:hypothetical protein ACOSQ2_003997 [Xanthoceras sorbifolium]
MAPITPMVQQPTANLPADQLHSLVETRNNDQASLSGTLDLYKMVERQAKLERMVAKMSHGYHLLLQNHPSREQIVESAFPPRPARDGTNHHIPQPLEQNPPLDNTQQGGISFHFTHVTKQARVRHYESREGALCNGPMVHVNANDERYVELNKDRCSALSHSTTH